MMGRWAIALPCAIGSVLILAACSRSPEPPESPTPAPEPSRESAAVEPAPPAPEPAPPAPGPEPSAEAPKPAPAAPASPAPTPAPAPSAPAPKPAAPPPAPPATPQIVDVGGLVEVAPTKAGLSRVGANQCKLCHKLQFASWSETAHAKRTPPLDCEGCHGPGSEYKAMAIMKDPQKATAAGLVVPGRDFCATCHRGGWSDDLLVAVHAHKPS